MERELALEFARVTEAAALAAQKWVGRGDKNLADGAAVEAMRNVLNRIKIDGEIVIGENFVFNEGDLLRHTDSTARNEQLSYAVKPGLSAQAISEI